MLVRKSEKRENVTVKAIGCSIKEHGKRDTEDRKRERDTERGRAGEVFIIQQSRAAFQVVKKKSRVEKNMIPNFGIMLFSFFRSPLRDF